MAAPSTPVVEQPETDRAVAALAQRRPLVLRDVQEWVRLNPEAARFRAAPPPTHASIRFADRDFLFHPHLPEAAARRLNAAPGQALNHVFPNVASFLHFLAQPQAADCAASDRWQPLVLLPLQHAAHLQEYLSSIPPRDWPWLLLEPRHFLADEIAAAQASSLAAQMIDWLGQMTRELGKSIAQLYADLSTPRQVLLDKQRPVRVMALAYEGSAYQRYCARDVVDGLLANGVEARACIASGTPAAEFEVLRAVHDFRPDVLLLNGRQRGNLPPLPENLCILSWDQDHALCSSPHYAKQAGPRDLLMVMVAEWAAAAEQSDVTPTRVAYINIGANPRVYHPPKAPHRDFEYDVLFAGNIQPFEAYKKAIGFAELPGGAQRLMLHARAKLAEWLAAEREDEHRPYVLPDCDDLLRRCAAELGGDAGTSDQRHWSSLVHYFRYRIAHLLVREHFVSALSEFRLGLFGRGWEAFPRLAPLAKPEVANGPELLELIQRSAINLHLHTWTVHHPRLYDTAAAGGFLLVGRVPEQTPLETVFSTDELDSFGSVAELKRKVRHYLSHPEQRQAMAARAAARAALDHTMDRRMAQLVDFLGKDVYGAQHT